MRYVFFGDSNACGLELEDHLMLDRDFETVNAMKAELLEKHDIKTAITKWHIYMANQVWLPPEEYITRPVKNSYPYLLAEKHNVDYAMHTRTAGSIDLSLLKLQNLHATNQINPDNDILFVGLCRPTRTYTLSKQTGDYDYRFENTSGLDVTDPQTAQKLKRIGLGSTEILSEFLTDHKLVATFYSALNSVIDFARANNYKLHLIPHFERDFIRVDTTNKPPAEKYPYKTHCETDPDWHLREFCIQTYNKALEYMVDSYLYHFQGDRPRCGFYHSDIEAHQQFAEYLAKNIDKASFNQ